MSKTSRLRDQLYMLQGSRCFYCDRPIPPNDRSLEHIIADSIGGYANDENTVVVCQEANHLLGDASPKRKMMMLKAGGGKIECPKLGSCAKPEQTKNDSLAHLLAPTEALHKTQPRQGHQDDHMHEHSTVQKRAHDTAPTHGHNGASNQSKSVNAQGVHAQQHNKAKKKPRPHLKGTSAVH